MTKFIWKKYLIEKNDGEFIGTSFTSTLNIDVTNFRKEVNTADFGAKTKSCFAKNLNPGEKQVSFRKECVHNTR